MKITTLTLLLMGTCYWASAQTAPAAQVMNEGHNLARYLASSNTQQLYTFSTRFVGVDGHPFFSEELQYGQLETSEGEVFDQVPFRYNIYEDVIEYNKQGKKINLFSHQLKGFTFADPQTGQIHQFKNGFITGLDHLSQQTFFEIIYDEGRSVVLRRWVKTLQNVAASPSTPGMNTGSSKKKFSDRKEFGYVVIDGVFKEVKLSRKGFYKAFPGYEKRIKTYIKKNLLVCRTVEDLVTVTRYYDRMIERKEAREKKG